MPGQGYSKGLTGESKSIAVHLLVKVMAKWAGGLEVLDGSKDDFKWLTFYKVSAVYYLSKLVADLLRFKCFKCSTP